MNTFLAVILFQASMSMYDATSTDWRRDITVNGVRYESHEIGPARYIIGRDPSKSERSAPGRGDSPSM